MLQKCSSMETQSNNLLKEFHPSGKRVKLLPPGFVFIPVINQIRKESWKKFKGKEGKLQLCCIFLVTPMRICPVCTFPCLKCSVECSLLFVIIFSTSSYVGTVVCTHVWILSQEVKTLCLLSYIAPFLDRSFSLLKH